jgi:hypothetical protein
MKLVMRLEGSLADVGMLSRIIFIPVVSSPKRGLARVFHFRLPSAFITLTSRHFDIATYWQET